MTETPQACGVTRFTYTSSRLIIIADTLKRNGGSIAKTFDVVWGEQWWPASLDSCVLHLVEAVSNCLSGKQSTLPVEAEQWIREARPQYFNE